MQSQPETLIAELELAVWSGTRRSLGHAALGARLLEKGVSTEVV